MGIMIFEKFNSAQDHIGTIKDIFQELIDDYDIHLNINKANSIYNGYCLDISSGDDDITLYLRLFNFGTLANHNLDISNQIRRLESLGYTIKNRSYGSTQIILYIDYSDV